MNALWFVAAFVWLMGMMALAGWAMSYPPPAGWIGLPLCGAWLAGTAGVGVFLLGKSGL